MTTDDRRQTTVVLGNACDRDAPDHCITCSDEALPVRVLSVNELMGWALVELVDVKSDSEEVDITLVDAVAPGDLLLVHGGVALSNLGREEKG